MGLLNSLFGSAAQKTRCPLCGKTDKHQKVEKSLEELETMRRAYEMFPEGSALKKMSAPTPDNDEYKCRYCSHMFKLSIAKTYAGYAEKYGEPTAISEYKDAKGIS
jgi:uncharacterized Zn-finger protein